MTTSLTITPLSVPTMKISQSQKRNPVLTYMGYEYLQSRTINGLSTWRCRENRSFRCHAIIKTQDGNIVQHPTEHCHDSCPQKAQANIARSQMREEMSEVGVTPSSVMSNIMSQLSNDVLAHFPKRSSVARNLINHRVVENLPNPTTETFNIPEKYHQLVLHDSGANDPYRILVLGDLELLAELVKDTIYGDGTFDDVPAMFYQLYTWHAKVGNTYPPCVYILLQKKNSETYNKMFHILKSLLPNWAPQKVLVDLEKACMSAVTMAFPHSQVKGCYFHLCQSLIRKIGNVGLKTEFEVDIETKLKLKSLAALSFVPPSDVRRVFDALAASFPDEERHNAVLTYFFSTYIAGAAGRTPQYPIEVWNHHSEALERSSKIINCCEGFHNALNSLFHCNNPSVWSLLDGLQRDLAAHRVTLANARAGLVGAKKRRVDALHQSIATSVQEYGQVEDKLHYLRKLANLTCC